eukprot:3165192-Alexandrium_andersonii.AAC.1
MPKGGKERNRRSTRHAAHALGRPKHASAHASTAGKAKASIPPSRLAGRPEQKAARALGKAARRR